MKYLSSTPDGLGNINSLAYYLTRFVMPMSPAGFTIDPFTLQTPVFDKSTFIVSLKDYEQRFISKPNFSQVANWIHLNNLILYRPGSYVGGWRDGRVYFLDVSIAIKGKIAALNAAYANQQVAIYHPFSGESFYLPKAA